jgi:tetratricopeptide (TPR) repeat protein/transcriptional regulator with XRE-family HTH domain
MESLSELLRGFRNRAGLTQAALAEKAGLSEQAISVLERGTRSRPRIDTIRSLTAALGLSRAEAELFLTVARGKSTKPRPSTPAPAPERETDDGLPMPWQLPPTVADFTGRVAQIEAILAVLRVPAADSSDAVRLVTVTGMGGIGKTALAVQAAHKLSDSYPDGHLYLNLHGYGPGRAMSTIEALRQLLRSLGLDTQLIPETVEEATALLRSHLAGRRVLMVLDNATEVRDVLPLLPGSPGSAAIVTSRGSLATLPGARQIRLDVLSESESVELLTTVIGPARVAEEPGVAGILASFTGRLPLAVRVIGGRLAARPSWPIQHLVDLLRDEERRLDSLDADETGVRTSIASSVRFLETSDRELDREAARALPLLSVPDGSDLATLVAARLLDIPDRRADAILERLVDLNLLESVSPERYRFHDLIRAYAREVAARTLTAAERDAGLQRIVRFYVGFGWATQAKVHPSSPRLSLASVPFSLPPANPDTESALSWFDAEQPNLIDRYHQAAASSLAGSPLFPELALSLFGYFEARSRWVEMRELAQGAVESADKLGLPSMAAWLEHDSAIPEVEDGSLDLAAVHLLEAYRRFRAIGDSRGQARAASSATHVLGRLDRLSEALELGSEALRLSQQVGDITVEGVSHVALGGLYDRIGDHTRADESFRRGIALAEEAGDLRSITKRYLNTGFSHLLVGRTEDAIAPLTKSIESAALFRSNELESQSWQLLAAVYASRGEYRRAHECIDKGLVSARLLGNRLREALLIFERGKISAAAGETEAAISSLRSAISALHSISPHFEDAAEELLAVVERGEHYVYAFDQSQVR